MSIWLGGRLYPPVTRSTGGPHFDGVGWKRSHNCLSPEENLHTSCLIGSGLGALATRKCRQPLGEEVWLIDDWTCVYNEIYFVTITSQQYPLHYTHYHKKREQDQTERKIH